MKQLCEAVRIKNVVVEVVDPENLTVAGLSAQTGAATMRVIINGEHALLDCYEHAKGCVPIGPGKYYGQFDADKASIWVDHDIPLTHKHIRDHYVIAGGW